MKMKKVTLLITILCLIATAQNDRQEQNYGRIDENNWLNQYGLNKAYCQKFLSDTLTGDSCSKERKEGLVFPFKDDPLLNEWVNLSITGQKVLNVVRRPGTFASIGPTLRVRSNCDIDLTFEGFDNLHTLTTFPGSHDSVIEKWFYLTERAEINPIEIPALAWVPAPVMSRVSIHIPASRTTDYTTTIWEKIYVKESNPACEYKDPQGATIVLTLTVIKPWIDTLTGHYNSGIP